MDPAQFHSPQAGRAIRDSRGYFAFEPAPPPLNMLFTRETLLALSEAQASLKNLQLITGQTGAQYSYLFPCFSQREGICSSRIEGIHATHEQIWLSDLFPDNKAATQAVLNCIATYSFSIQRVRELPLSLRLVREAHERLMSGFPGNGHPGEFRTSQNWIGGDTLETAEYVPPPPETLMENLGTWELFLHARGNFPELVRVAFIHEWFEAIHPFVDGNGRIGRLLIPLCLLDAQQISTPIFTISDYLLAHQNEYYERLHRVRTDGDWNGWLVFFLNGVEEMAEKNFAIFNNLTSLKQKLENDAKRTLAGDLLPSLFQNPLVTPQRVSKYLNIDEDQARKMVDQFFRAGILRPFKAPQQQDVYTAWEIQQAVETRLG